MKKYTIFTVLLAMAFIGPIDAQTLTFTAGNAEVSTSTKNQLYGIDDLVFSYNRNSEVFEARLVETRESIFRSNISNVTISGLSTAAAKIAWLENTHLKANTAQFNHLIPKNGLAVRYATSGKAASLFGRYMVGKTPLWSGNVDSIKTAAEDNTTSLRLAALRKMVRGATPRLIGNDANAATISVGAASGSGGSATITGNALSGEIDIDTGSSTTTTGVLATVTLPQSCPSKCLVTITPSSTFGSTQIGKVFVTTTGNTFVLNANGTALTASTADFKVFYQVTCR